MKFLLYFVFSALLFCSSALAVGQPNWDYRKFHEFNMRVAESINKLSTYGSYEKIRQAIKNPKDQDALKTLYIKMKSHPLKAFPLFDRLLISSGKSIHTVRVHSFEPFVLSVDAQPSVEVDLDNVHRAFSGKSAANGGVELFWSSANAQSTPDTYTTTEFLSLYGLVTKSFGNEVFKDETLKPSPDRKLKNDAQKILLAESVAEFMNYFKVKQFICPNMDEIKKKLGQEVSTAKNLFLMTTQDGKRIAGSCKESNVCQYYPLMPYGGIEGRDFLVPETTRARELAIKALQDKNVLQRATPDELSVQCAAKGLGIGAWNNDDPKALDESKIAKQDQCYLSPRDYHFGDRDRELSRTLELPDNELLTLAREKGNEELTRELQKALKILRQRPLTADGYVLPQLTKNGAVEALNDCCKDSACRKEFTHNGQAVFSDYDSRPEYIDPNPESEVKPATGYPKRRKARH